MTRSQLIQRLSAENHHLTQHDVERVVTMIFEQISASLEQGGRVELRGFGVFSIRERSARLSRNPRNGEPVQVQAKAVPFFKSGKDLRLRLNLGNDA